MKFVCLITLLVLSMLSCSRAEVFRTQIEQASSEDGAYAQFSLWIPAGSHPDRLIALIWGSNQCSLDAVNDPGWQELARAIGCGLLTCFFEPQSADNHWDHVADGSGQALMDALQDLARTSGESQLAEAQLYLVGDSQGGQFAFRFAAWKPDRVLGFISLKGGHHDPTSVPGAARTPGLFFVGQLDAPFRVANIVRTFAQGRVLKAPWCLAIDPHAKHDPDSCGPLVRAFLKDLSTTTIKTIVSLPFPAIDHDQILNFSYPDSWFPNPKFKKDRQLFQAGKLALASPKLSFASEMPVPAGNASPSSVDAGPLASGSLSRVITLQVTPNSPGMWDDIKVLNRSYLSEINDGKVLPPRVPVSLRFSTIGLPLGRFSGAIPIRFEHDGKALLGGLNIPLTAVILGDVVASPSLIYLGQIHPRSHVLVSLQIDSKAGGLISFLSCKTPDGVEKVSSSTPANPFHLTFSFAFGEESPGEAISGSIVLHLQTTKNWVIRIPYVGSFKE